MRIMLCVSKLPDYSSYFETTDKWTALPLDKVYFTQSSLSRQMRQ